MLYMTILLILFMNNKNMYNLILRSQKMFKTMSKILDWLFEGIFFIIFYMGIIFLLSTIVIFLSFVLFNTNIVFILTNLHLYIIPKIIILFLSLLILINIYIKLK